MSDGAAVTDVDLVARIWARDPAVWTGDEEAKWLGWLDEPKRVREDVDLLLQLADAVADEVDAVVLLGMGGSSLAPEVLKRAFRQEAFHVLDTTHPQAIRALESQLDLSHTLFISASKSGSTLETRSHTDYFWEQTGRGEQWVAITDPGSALEALAGERSFRAVFPGEPTIGGRYSALSPFGMVPAALMGIDLTRLLERSQEMAEACRLADGNPGVELGRSLGDGWRDGRDKVTFEDVNGFGLWVEQLLAESTGKQGKGLVPAPGESADGGDRQAQEVRLPDAYELGQEFFRWEFATAVAGSILGINPFDQPDVQAAKDRTNQVLAGGDVELAPESSPDELFAQARPGDYVCIQAFVDPTPANEEKVLALAAGARDATGCVVTHGFGPRYLHSTGQLHKGGPNTGLFLQVVDDTGDELPIPDQPFGFARLIRAQAAGDYESLKERGRRVARIHIEEA
jgi:transaldolase/glucose-6-phosphate isomerase